MYGTLNLKKAQRRINKDVRELNKALEQDPLWRGRFCVRQVGRRVYWFEDGSGLYIYPEFYLIDKKTGVIGFCIQEDGLFFAACLAWRLNDFIVDELKCKLEQSEIDYSEVDIELPTYNEYKRAVDGWWGSLVKKENGEIKVIEKHMFRR